MISLLLEHVLVVAGACMVPRYYYIVRLCDIDASHRRERRRAAAELHQLHAWP